MVRKTQVGIVHLSNVDNEILKTIDSHGGECLQAAIISAMLPGVNMTYVYSRIKRMEAGGLLDKTGPANGRTITLTAAGKAMLTA